MEGQRRYPFDDLFNQIKAGSVKELNIVVKADTQGAVEAVRQSLEKLSNSEVVIRIIHGGVGAVTESDVTLASASNSIIIGFNVAQMPGRNPSRSGNRWIFACIESSTMPSRTSKLQ